MVYLGERWGEKVGRASDAWGLGFPRPHGLGEQVPPPPRHDLQHITSNLGSAPAVDRQVGAHGQLGGGRGKQTQNTGLCAGPGWFRDRKGSTLKADQADNTSNKTTKGGASQRHRWGTVCTRRREGDKLEPMPRKCRFEVQLGWNPLQARLWQEAGCEQVPVGFEGQAECTTQRVDPDPSDLEGQHSLHLTAKNLRLGRT